jgi:glycogen synthase
MNRINGNAGCSVAPRATSAHVPSQLDGVPMRLLYVTPRYLPHMGGVENHVHQVATRLSRSGVDVTVLTTRSDNQLPSAETIEGVRVRRVQAWPAQRDYYFAPELLRQIAAESWDVVHVQSYHTLVAPMAMLGALRAKRPYVLTFHGGGHPSRLRSLLRRPQRALLRPLIIHAARLVAVARFEVDLFSRELHLPRDRFVLIPNGADLPPVAPPLTPTGQGETLLVSIGRLERYKGHHRVIAALPHVLAHLPHTRLWIAGSGPDEAQLRRQAETLGVGSRVEIRAVPLAERARLAQELSQAALVTLMSEYETHPIAAIEARALGCRVLVADTSGLRELADDGLARAVPLHSTPRELASAILSQLSEPPDVQPLDLPTWDDCAARLHSLYNSLYLKSA